MSIQLTKEQRTALLNWIESNKSTNWGTWGNYPELPVRATYLSYEDAPVVVKLDEPITVEFFGDKITSRYISATRKCPGAKGPFLTTLHLSV